MAERNTPPLSGKRALVTGSTGGIGLGVARALAEAGAAVVLNGRSSETQARNALDSVGQAANGDVHYVQADLSTQAGVEALIENGRMALGGIDILINNAGVQHVAPLTEFPPDKWNLILALNLSAAFHATRLILPGMTEAGWGRIVNIASAHALVASPYKSAYVAAKHGLLGLTKVAALETAELDVTCNAICPGYVRTPLVDKQIDAQAKAHGIPKANVIRDVILKPQPNKRFATEEEIGALTVLLCSPAGRSITGAALPMDGGWTAH